MWVLVTAGALMRMLRHNSYVIVGWLGSILGIVRGINLVTHPIYTHASDSASPLDELTSGTELVIAEQSLDIVAVAAGVLVVLLVFGILLVLLTLGKRELFAVYSFNLLFLSVMSLPSIGWVFLPATGLSAIAGSLFLLLGPNSRGATSSRI